MKSPAIRTLLVASVLSFSAHANPANNQLLKMPEPTQKEFFAKFLKGSGQTCGTVTRIFYRGIDKQGNGYWAVACSKGEAVQIQVANNSTGSTSLLECRVMKQLNAGDCFKKI